MYTPPCFFALPSSARLCHTRGLSCQTPSRPPASRRIFILFNIVTFHRHHHHLIHLSLPPLLSDIRYHHRPHHHHHRRHIHHRHQRRHQRRHQHCITSVCHLSDITSGKFLYSSWSASVSFKPGFKRTLIDLNKSLEGWLYSNGWSS